MLCSVTVYNVSVAFIKNRGQTNRRKSFSIVNSDLFGTHEQRIQSENLLIRFSKC